MTDTAEECWLRVRARLRSSVGEDTYQSWFAGVHLESVEKESAHLSVPTRFLKSWIQAHYVERVLLCFQAEMPGVRRIDFTVRSIVRCVHQVKKAEPGPVTPFQKVDAPPPQTIATASIPANHNALGGSPLNPRFTLESFVSGHSNRLAYAAVKVVVESRQGDSAMFNPLYIHSAVGLGKTHLLQAIAWAGNASSERKVLYLTAEKLLHGFKETLLGIDVLLIDNMQYLHGKASQNEFCHRVNAYMDAGHQVVLAADRPPADLECLDDRIRSRLSGGLVVAMGPLEEEMRLALLASRVTAAQAHYALFEVSEDVLTYLAHTIPHNGRDLEGAVNRLLAQSKLNGMPVTLEMAEREVADFIRTPEPRRIKIEDIQRVVARQYQVSRTDLLSSRRTANVVRPRQVAMYLAKILTLRSLPEIGRRFGGRDHTTVLHAIRKIEGLIGKDEQLSEEIASMKREIEK